MECPKCGKTNIEILDWTFAVCLECDNRFQIKDKESAMEYLEEKAKEDQETVWEKVRLLSPEEIKLRQMEEEVPIYNLASFIEAIKRGYTPKTSDEKKILKDSIDVLRAYFWKYFLPREKY